jgi:hypothetical protein
MIQQYHSWAYTQRMLSHDTTDTLEKQQQQKTELFAHQCLLQHCSLNRQATEITQMPYNC